MTDHAPTSHSAARSRTRESAILRAQSFCSWAIGRVVRDEIYRRPRAKKAFTRVVNALGGSKPVTRFIAGQSISVVPSASIVEFRMAVCRAYEPAMTRYLQETLQPGMVVADVGAHIGYFTLLAASRVGPTGCVVSFEPHPRNFRQLRHNVALNGHDHVQPLQKALAATRGSMKLNLAHDDTAFTTMASISSDATVDVDVETLDEVLRGLGIDQCDFIKVDIEGAELLALRGMIETIERNPQLQFVIEVHSAQIRDLGGTARELAEMMLGFGYQLSKLDDDGRPQPLAEAGAFTDEELGGYLVCRREAAAPISATP